MKELKEFILENNLENKIDKELGYWRYRINDYAYFKDIRKLEEKYKIHSYIKQYILDDVKDKLKELNKLSKKGVEFESWDYDKRNSGTFLIYSNGDAGIVTDNKITKPGEVFKFIGMKADSMYNWTMFDWKCDGKDIYIDLSGKWKKFEELSVNNEEDFIENFYLSYIEIYGIFSTYKKFRERYDNFINTYNSK